MFVLVNCEPQTSSWQSDSFIGDSFKQLDQSEKLEKVWLKLFISFPGAHHVMGSWFFRMSFVLLFSNFAFYSFERLLCNFSQF